MRLWLERQWNDFIAVVLESISKGERQTSMGMDVVEQVFSVPF